MNTNEIILAIVIPVMITSLISFIKINVNQQNGKLSIIIPRLFPFVQDSYTYIGST